jgi:uncharacterized protein (TIGR02453 family)
MNFQELFDFLLELNQNNSKEWMDAHRKRYERLRDSYKKWLQEMDVMLAEVDPEYFPTLPGKAINRINNNLLYHPNKPVYKDHFGAGLDKRPKTGDFYMHLGIEEKFIGGGFYRPTSDLLKSIREAIDYNGEELVEIIEKPSFERMFGGLYEDEELTNAPKGFDKNHPHIDLLKKKTFVVMYDLKLEEILSPNYKDLVKEVYLEMLPFRRYLNKAVTV